MDHGKLWGWKGNLGVKVSQKVPNLYENGGEDGVWRWRIAFSGKERLDKAVRQYGPLTSFLYDVTV